MERSMWDQQIVDLHVGVVASSIIGAHTFLPLVDTYKEDSRNTQALLGLPWGHLQECKFLNSRQMSDKQNEPSA